ncbi:hypothetical protein Calab_1293 [Caldithrix abyssi DSM 13497]|uniref:Uncharacterized protein n=1 Tax=Caldithrix abyssi DSM 13497 TaxID=880073 RepID=H1XYP9_CALAY|nr:hypothetical protein [Caldithrix abyssi]APF20571.1 hypothetical protein Cabys_3826 [Caldithrix abyssi DSM 13497]EHO40918.1 hypothetical protein Calab_1293 [Caldithrix abyssi DSM 13497]
MHFQNPVDLKQLIRFIVDEKKIQANLILDEGCFLETADIRPLIKVINYVLNYLKQLSDHPIEISLDLMHDKYLYSFLVYTTISEPPPFSANLQAVLDTYSAKLDFIHEKGKYVQVKIHIKR